MWQDIVIASSSIIFGLLLIPQLKDVIYRKKSMNLYTTGLTAAFLFLINGVYLSLGLVWSAIPFCSTIWAILFIYSWKNYGSN